MRSYRKALCVETRTVGLAETQAIDDGGRMDMARRDALKATGATVRIVSPRVVHGAVPIAALTDRCWISYPGQLAAWRHLRRVKHAVERRTKVGYPANFRQPLTQAYFRKAGNAERDMSLRWFSPVARVRVVTRKRSGDITICERVTTPVRAISRGIILGIEPMEAGYRRCRIAPQRCGLPSVDGSLPTPHGEIMVSWHNRRGTATIPARIVALVDGREVTGPGSFSFQLR